VFWDVLIIEVKTLIDPKNKNAKKRFFMKKIKKTLNKELC